jgi:hypothetical protein
MPLARPTDLEMLGSVHENGRGGVFHDTVVLREVSWKLARSCQFGSFRFLGIVEFKGSCRCSCLEFRVALC